MYFLIDGFKHYQSLNNQGCSVSMQDTESEGHFQVNLNMFEAGMETFYCTQKPTDEQYHRH